jgi:tetratricopeptide (TPR) repeat protein
MVHFGMGVVCMFKKQYDEALHHFDKAIEIYPYFVEAWFNKGAAHQYKMNPDETLKAFRKVIQLGDPADDFVHQAKNFIREMEKELQNDGMTLDNYLQGADIFHQAFAAMQNRQWQKALAGFKRAAAFNPRHPQTHGNMGICYGQLGQRQEALAAFDRALEIDPDYEPALLNRIMIEALQEGEALPEAPVGTIEYYKDYPMQKKSLIEQFANKLLPKS